MEILYYLSDILYEYNIKFKAYLRMHNIIDLYFYEKINKLYTIYNDSMNVNSLKIKEEAINWFIASNITLNPCIFHFNYVVSK